MNVQTIFKKSSFVKILMSFFLFLFIFAPTVTLSFNIRHIPAIISLFFLLTKYKKRFFQILESSELFVFITLIFFITIYSFALDPFSTENYRISFSYAVAFLEILLCAIFVSFCLLEHKINIKKFYDIILLIGMLQVACVLLTMIYPSLREWIIKDLYNQGFIGVYDEGVSFRIYGLASGYTFSMPLFQGLCVIIAFILGSYESSKYYLLIPFFLVSIAVNARVAFISILIVPFVVFFFRFKKQPIKQIASILFMAFSILIMVKFIQYMAVNSSLSDVWYWLNEGIDELLNLREGEKTGNISNLADMWFMPKEIYELIFGTGENVFVRGHMNSDIGYVRNLYYGGFVYSIVLYCAYLFLLIKYYNNSMTEIEKNISITIILYLFAANLKGNVFVPNEIISGVLVLIIFSIVKRKFYTTNT